MPPTHPMRPELKFLHHGWLATVALLTHGAVGALMITIAFALDRYVHWLYGEKEAPKVFGTYTLEDVLRGGDAVLVIIVIGTGAVSALRILGRQE